MWHDSRFYSKEMRREGRAWSTHKIIRRESLVTNFLPASWFLTDVMKNIFLHPLSLGFREDPKECFVLWSHCGLRVISTSQRPREQRWDYTAAQLKVNKQILTGRWRLWPRELPNGSSHFDHRSPKVSLSKSAALCVCVCTCVYVCVCVWGGYRETDFLCKRILRIPQALTKPVLLSLNNENKMYFG